MGNIPVFNPRRSIPGAMPAPKASMSVAAATGRAVAGLGAEIEDRIDAARQKRQVAQATDQILATTREINDLNLWAAQEPDYQTLVSEYEKRTAQIQDRKKTEIRDPDVYKVWHREFLRMSERGRVKTAELASAREQEHNRAVTRAALDEYADLIAQAADFEEAADYIKLAHAALAGAVTSGAFDEDTAGKLQRQFSDAAHVNFIKRDIRDDPDGALLSLQEDHYPGLAADIKSDLMEYARTMSLSRLSDRVRRSDLLRKEQEMYVDEKNLEMKVGITALALTKKLDTSLIIEAGKQRVLTPTEMRSMYDLSRRVLAEPVPDDPEVLLDLITEMQSSVRGDGMEEKIKAFVGRGISIETAEKYLNKVPVFRAANDVSKDPVYKAASGYIDDHLTVSGPGSLLYKPDELARKARALEEFETRVRGGEDIHVARDDIVRRYRATPLSLYAFPAPIYGSKSDLAGAWRRTKEAYERKEISPETYRREIFNLRQLVAAQEQRNARPGQMDPEEVRQKLKERKSQ